MTTVYVSATRNDLAECREAVRLVCERLGMVDVAMESYVANSDLPLTKCLEDVERCDLYIGLFAWRYGFIPAGHDRSITELEYRKARELGKPCLIFLLKDDAPWPGNQIDHGPDGERMAALRRELTETHLCSFFRGPDDLAAQATAALANHQSNQPPKIPVGRGSKLDETVSKERWDDYFVRLCQRCLGVELDALTPSPSTEFLQIPLTSVFVEPDVREDARPDAAGQQRTPRAIDARRYTGVPGGAPVVNPSGLGSSYPTDPAWRLFDLLTDPGRRATVLLGDPGAGKSAVARYLGLCLAGGHVEPRLAGLKGYVPLLIELRSYVGLVNDGKCENFLEYLDHRARVDGLGVDKHALTRYLAEGGKALLLFDGLDEIFNPRRRDEVASQIAAFATAYPSIRVLVTARIVGHHRRTLSEAGFHHVTLEDLDEPQIAEFLTRWYERVIPGSPHEATYLRLRMLSAIRSSPAIRELAGNPLLLSILAIVGRNQELPKERWNLYDHAANVLVEYWDANRHLRDNHGDTDFLDTDDKKKLLRRLAYRMQSQQQGLNPNYIEHDQLSRLFEDYLVERYEHPRARAHALANSMIDHFHQRNFILGRYGQHMYGFVHRTFLEYFYAQAIVRKYQQGDPEWTLAHLTALVTEHWAEPAWREVVRLLVGAVDAEAAGSLIRLLAVEVNRPWPPDEFVEPPWNLALAVQCLAEVRTTADVGVAAELLLRQLILLIEHGVSLKDRNTTELIEAEILPAIRVIGTGWPRRQSYLSWYRRRGIAVSWTTGSAFATQVAVLLSTPPDHIEELLEATVGAVNDRRARLALIAGLAESAALPVLNGSRPAKARLERSRALLTQRAATDSHSAARRAALQALVVHVPLDGNLVTLVRERAADDNNADVRLLAVRTLAGRPALDETDRTLLIGRVQHDPDGPVRQAAIEVLGRRFLGSDEVRALVIDRIRSERDVGAFSTAVAALLDHSDSSHSDSNAHVRSILANRLSGDIDDAIRRTAARLLGESFTDYDTRELLLTRVRRDNDPGTRSLALQGLMRLPDDGSLRGLLIERIEQDDDASLRLDVQRTLIDRHPNDLTIGHLLAKRSQEDQDAAVREAAVVNLAEHFADAEALSALVAAAGDDQAAGVRIAATAALTDNFATEPVSRRLVIEQIGGDRDAMVRLAAIRLLVKIDMDTDAYDQLLERVRLDPDPQVIREAATILNTVLAYRPPVAAALRERISTDTYAGVRLAAIEVLVRTTDGRAGDPASVQTLVDRARDDGDAAVFRAAVEALATMPTSTMPTGEPIGGRTPILKQLLLDRVDDVHWPIRLPALELLGTYFGEDQDVRVRIMDCTHPGQDVQVRRTALAVLGRDLAGYPEVHVLLRDLVTDPDWSLRCAAARALGERSGADDDVRSLFVELARDDPNPDFRRAIGQALTWLPDADPDLLPDVAVTLDP